MLCKKAAENRRFPCFQIQILTVRGIASGGSGEDLYADGFCVLPDKRKPRNGKRIVPFVLNGLSLRENGKSACPGTEASCRCAVPNIGKMRVFSERSEGRVESASLENGSQISVRKGEIAACLEFVFKDVIFEFVGHYNILFPKYDGQQETSLPCLSVEPHIKCTLMFTQK